MAELKNSVNDDDDENGNGNNLFYNSSKNVSIKIYKKLLYLQLIPSLFSFVKRFVALFGIQLFGELLSVPNVMDEITVLVFYIKIIVIIESSSDLIIQTI